MPEERPANAGRPPERQQFHGPRPFRPNPRPDAPSFSQPHTVRVRDGDREFEVSGSAAFVRQIIDDLGNIWSQLHGDGPSRPASIRMPQPPKRNDVPEPEPVAEEN